MRYAAPGKETKRLEEAMSTVYRYRKSGNRLFYKVTEEGYNQTVTRIRNKASFSQVDISKNSLITADAFEDGTTEITESEFNTAYKEAMERISSGKI